MKFYRGMLKIQLAGHVSRKMETNRILILRFRHRQLTFVGHNVRKGSLEDITLAGHSEIFSFDLLTRVDNCWTDQLHLLSRLKICSTAI